ncbi:PREDICTED: uncharacterized protein LOC104018292 [Nipponia nippon]|uniref:uncharacterized protein LOC104018292 n=1 Tax=Nipponia nippon TaxID=128390 RepID=UPI000511A21A|nr:PREDICTED: uncharacterized protein LOC104018292 [Nipponia nippon]
MSSALLGTLLLLLPGGASAEGTGLQQSPGQLWVLPGQTANLSCRIPDHGSYVNWYKEKPDGTLHWIYRSSKFSSPKGKYSGRMENQYEFSLAISPAQREDSGVYYCSSHTFFPSFGNGTRLVVTNATQPQLSILVPADAEEPGQPPAAIPLLCRLHDLPPGWDTVRWQPGGQETPVTAEAVDERGVLSAWSITWLPAERAARTGPPASPSAKEPGRVISPSPQPPADPEGCPSWPLTLTLGLPCVSLLFLLQLTILLCRQRLAGAHPRSGAPSQPLRPGSRLASPGHPRAHPGHPAGR